MSDASDKSYQATDPIELRDQVMDCRVAKTEREWWSMRFIEKLESQLTAKTARIEVLEKALREALKWIHQCFVDDCCCEGAEEKVKQALGGEE